MTRALMEGSEAIAEAAIAAGCRFFAGYPMTPFTELLESFARRLHEQGGHCVNAESEIEAAALLATPDQLLDLKNAEHKFKVDIKKLDVDLEAVSAGDRDSARKRQIALKDNAPAIIAVVVFVGFFATLLALIFLELHASTRDPLLIMVGVLGAAVTGIIQYYFGSSSSSSKKNETIERMLNRSS